MNDLITDLFVFAPGYSITQGYQRSSWGEPRVCGLVPIDLLVCRGLRNRCLGCVLQSVEHGSWPRWDYLSPKRYQIEIRVDVLDDFFFVISTNPRHSFSFFCGYANVYQLLSLSWLSPVNMWCLSTFGLWWGVHFGFVWKLTKAGWLSICQRYLRYSCRFRPFLSMKDFE